MRALAELPFYDIVSKHRCCAWFCRDWWEGESLDVAAIWQIEGGGYRRFCRVEIPGIGLDRGGKTLVDEGLSDKAAKGVMDKLCGVPPHLFVSQERPVIMTNYDDYFAIGAEGAQSGVSIRCGKHPNERINKAIDTMLEKFFPELLKHFEKQ